MAPFNVHSQVCIAPIHVLSKLRDFAPHMDGSNAEFGKGAMPTLLRTWSGDIGSPTRKLVKIANFANLFEDSFQAHYF